MLRIDGGITDNRLKTGSKRQNLPILNTYDPQVGYNPDQIDTYFGRLNKYLDTSPKTPIRMRCTYHNGKIASPDKENGNNIGKCTLSNLTDKGNGGIWPNHVPIMTIFAQILTKYQKPGRTKSRHVV